MIEENEAAKAEGEALPVVTEKTAAPSWIKGIETEFATIEERAVDAIERWYAKHFHAAAVTGLPTLSADDKAALIQHVTEAVAPPQE